MVDTEQIAANLASRFDCDVFVYGVTRTPRPSGGTVEVIGDVAQTLRGRCRAFRRDTDARALAASVLDQTEYVVTVPRFSAVPLGARLRVVGITADQRWEHTLTVIGQTGPKSVYVVDTLYCAVVRA